MFTNRGCYNQSAACKKQRYHKACIKSRAHSCAARSCTPLVQPNFQGELHLRGARTRASDTCKINRRMRTCEARIVAIFLVWTSKLSKVSPKTCQDSHESATERPKRSTWSPKWCQEGSMGHSKGAQGTPRTPKERPRGSQRATKISKNHSWRPSGPPKKKKKQKIDVRFALSRTGGTSFRFFSSFFTGFERDLFLLPCSAHRNVHTLRGNKQS